MVSQAWAPGHATLVFAVPKSIDGKSDPLLKGSLGIGINFAAGVTTRVSPADQLNVYWNNEWIDGKVSLSVYEQFVELVKISDPITIHHYSELKIGHGLSTSGAGALGSALALNDYFQAGFSQNELYQIAHIADVVNHTGLGSVMGQITSGIEIRTKAGGPGIGVTETIFSEEKLLVLMIGRLHTDNVLTSDQSMFQINRSGKETLRHLNFNKEGFSLDKLIFTAREFAESCGLMTAKVKEISNKLIEMNEPVHTMAMIGETIVLKAKNPEEVLKMTRLHKIPTIVTHITSQKPFVF